ncbi:uncharacterized protein ACDP82_006098 [Pangshura tecta]
MQAEGGDPLTIYTQPSSSALLGSAALLKCRFNIGGPINLTALQVHWYFSDQSMAQYDWGKEIFAPGVSISEQELRIGNASLGMENVQMSDEGQYKCVVSYGAERQQSETTLRVFAAPRLSIPRRSARTDAASSFPCHVWGFYPQDVTVTWLRDGRVLTDATRSAPQRNPDGTFNLTLTYTFTPTASDSGSIFSCRASHAALAQPLREEFPLAVTDPADGLRVLTPLLDPKAVALYGQLGEGEKGSYESFQQAQLREFGLTPETHRERFRSQDQTPEVSCLQLAIAWRDAPAKTFEKITEADYRNVMDHINGLFRPPREDAAGSSDKTPREDAVLTGTDGVSDAGEGSEQQPLLPAQGRERSETQEQDWAGGTASSNSSGSKASDVGTGVSSCMTQGAPEAEGPSPNTEPLGEPGALDEEQVGAASPEAEVAFPAQPSPAGEEEGETDLSQHSREATVSTSQRSTAGRGVPGSQSRAAANTASDPAREEDAQGEAGVPQAPVLGEISRPQGLAPGEQVTLSCQISRFYPKELSVTWYRQKRGETVFRCLNNLDTHKIDTPDPTAAPDRKSYSVTSQLRLTPMLPEDDGAEYLCSVEHETLQEPEGKSTGPLELQGLLRPPEVSEISQPEPVTEGEEITLSCRMVGHFPGELNVTWLQRNRGDGAAVRILNSAEYRIEYGAPRTQDGKSFQQETSLSFTPSVQRDQGAKYVCRVGHVTLGTPLERCSRELQVTGRADSAPTKPSTSENRGRAEEPAGSSGAAAVTSPLVEEGAGDMAPKGNTGAETKSENDTHRGTTMTQNDTAQATPAREQARDGAASPTPAKRDTTSPTPAKRDTASPTPAKRGTTSPTPAKRDTTSPTPAKRDTASPTPAKRDTTSPTPAKRDTASPTPAKRGTTSPTPTKRDTTSPTPAKRDTTSNAAAKERAGDDAADEDTTSELAEGGPGGARPAIGVVGHRVASTTPVTKVAPDAVVSAPPEPDAEASATRGGDDADRAEWVEEPGADGMAGAFPGSSKQTA